MIFNEKLNGKLEYPNSTLFYSYSTPPKKSTLGKKNLSSR